MIIHMGTMVDLVGTTLISLGSGTRRRAVGAGMGLWLRGRMGRCRLRRICTHQVLGARKEAIEEGLGLDGVEIADGTRSVKMQNVGDTYKLARPMLGEAIEQVKITMYMKIQDRDIEDKMNDKDLLRDVGSEV